MFHKISGIENFNGVEGVGMRMEYPNLLPTFFCLRVPNYFVEEPFRVSLISGIENFCA